MDYEKKYNEALERAKELIALLDKVKLQATQADIYEIFPELCESEGERIRKTLMDIVGRIVERAFTEEGVTKTSVLAWLEKQKPVYDTTFEKWLDDWYQGSKEAGGDVVMSEAEFKNWSRGIRNMYQQKPVEWSYPYGRNETVDRLVSISECLEMDGDCLFNGYSGTDCGKFLRELARKQIECKPVEWSEEDEHRITDAIYFLESAKSHYADTSELDAAINFLKSLHERFNLQPRAEWSDEEKRHIQNLESVLYYDQHLSKETRIELGNFLKSLRPSWKPNKEQMVALQDSIDLDKTVFRRGKLVALLEDLKKLM